MRAIIAAIFRQGSDLWQGQKIGWQSLTLLNERLDVVANI